MFLSTTYKFYDLRKNIITHTWLKNGIFTAFHFFSLKSILISQEVFLEGENL